MTATTTPATPAAQTAGLTSYYQQKIELLELTVRDKTQNLRRLQAQRNELNSKGATCLFVCLVWHAASSL